MAQTQTTLTEAQARAEYAALEAATETWLAAVNAFGEKYPADTVGISEQEESIREWLFDIQADINATFDPL